MLQFCPISPTSYLRPLRVIRQSNTHLLLAHLFDDKTYVEYYKHAKSLDTAYIMDNSGFELFRAGKPMFDPNQLIELGKKVSADYIVLPDYPTEHPHKTIESAIEYAPKFKEAGVGTFFVPQGRPGNVDDLCQSFAWAASSPLINYIGVSILAAPVAYNCDQPGNIQTFLARIHFCLELSRRGLLKLAQSNGKLIHFLGMTDGPNEILLTKAVPDLYIKSWDSSSPVWAGIEGIAYDQSPTGLQNGKVTSHVDFNIEYDESKVPLIKQNLQYVQTTVKNLYPRLF